MQNDVLLTCMVAGLYGYLSLRVLRDHILATRPAWPLAGCWFACGAGLAFLVVYG